MVNVSRIVSGEPEKGARGVLQRGGGPCVKRNASCEEAGGSGAGSTALVESRENQCNVCDSVGTRMDGVTQDNRRARRDSGGVAGRGMGARQQAASAAVRAAQHQVLHRVQAAWCNLTGCCLNGNGMPTPSCARRWPAPPAPPQSVAACHSGAAWGPAMAGTRPARPLQGEGDGMRLVWDAE